MGNVGVIQYARFLQEKRVSGMAQKLGVKWPPPPVISVRDLLRLAGDLVAKRPDVVKAPWAVLLCKFSDTRATPFQRSYFQNLFTIDGAGTMNMTDFFRDASQRKLDVTGSAVFPPFGSFVIDKNRSDYKGNIDPPGGRADGGRADLVDWAKKAATKNAPGILDPYRVIVIVFNVHTDLFGGLGRAVCDSFSTASQIAQEMCHGYGLDHSRADNDLDSPLGGICLDGPPDYRDAWDTMSVKCAYQDPNADYTEVGPFLNAANMSGRDWLSGWRVWKANAPFSETIILRPLARPDLPGFIAARISDYVVEFRVKEGWDASIPRPAVLVHRFQGNASYIMSGTNIIKQDLVAGSFLEVGDPAGSGPWTKVEVLNIDAAYYTATVRLSRRN